MPIFSGFIGGSTPVTTNDNWTLQAGTAVTARVVACHWGGEVTTSTAMRTLVSRCSGTGTTLTAGNVQKADPQSAGNAVSFASSWATQPAVNTGAMMAESWNAHGGIFYWHAGNADEEIIMIGAVAANMAVSCRNAAGTGLSSYGVTWRE